MLKKRFVYVGSFEHNTFKECMSIYVAQMNCETGELSHIQSYNNCFNYGYICMNNSKKNLYGVNTRLGTGSVCSFSIDSVKGFIVFQKELELPGASLGIHIIVSNNDKFVLIAMGGSSNIYSCAVNEKGAVNKVVDIFQLPPGKGTVARQMAGPAPHQVCFDNRGKYLFVPDINSDRVLVLSFDNNNGKMRLLSSASVEGGEGPRHCVVHKNNKWVYLINEMGCSVYFFEFNKKAEKLEQKQTIKILPHEFVELHEGNEIQLGAIQFSPDGRFIFISMRNCFFEDGSDKIFRITIDENDGIMKDVKDFSCHGICPRMFDFTPDGEFMLIGNKFSNEVISVRYWKDTGSLGNVCGRIQAKENASLVAKDIVLE